MVQATDISKPKLPSLRELGDDLLRVSPLRRVITLALPFICMGGYAVFAWLGWWPLAVLSVMALCFITYGSSSHDLVHRTLGLSPKFNDFMLSLIELLSLRSGTAYRLSHLQHHRSLLASDDIEGSVAHGSLMKAILCGPTMQIQLWRWAWAKHKPMRPRLLIEAIGVMAIVAAGVMATRWSIAPAVYVALVVAGSWIFPLITVYIPHDVAGGTELTQTRRFRGLLVRLIAFDHLYHIEHHLYPAVPHHHWKTLADRLDPHFERAGVKAHGM